MKDDGRDGQRQEETWERGEESVERQGGGEQSGLSGVLKTPP